MHSFHQKVKTLRMILRIALTRVLIVFSSQAQLSQLLQPKHHLLQKTSDTTDN